MPGTNPTKFVALAIIGDRPRYIRAGNVKNEAPPAIADNAPPTMPTQNRTVVCKGPKIIPPTYFSRSMIAREDFAKVAIKLMRTHIRLLA